MGLRFWSRKREFSHDQLSERLSAYMDQQLPADEIARLESHLQGCESCQAELRSLQLTRRMLQSLPPARLPRSFTLQAAPRPQPMPRGFFYLRTATGMATAAFVALLAVSAVLPMASSPMAAPSRQTSGNALGAPAAAEPAAPAAAAAAPQRAAAPPAQERSSAPVAKPQAPAAAAPPSAAGALTAAPTPAPAPTQAARAFAAPAPATAAPAAAAAAPAAAAPAAPKAAQADSAAAEPAPAAGGAAAPAQPGAAPQEVSPQVDASAPATSGEKATTQSSAPAQTAPALPAAEKVAPTAAATAPAQKAQREDTGAAASQDTAPGLVVGPQAHPAPEPSSGEAALSQRTAFLNDTLFALEAVAGGLALLLAIATTGFWWTHRRRY